MPPSPTDPPARGPLVVGYRVGGRYELTRRIARGGMAEVWEAEDTVLARPVAVKALLPHLAADEAFVTRFRREAVAAARLSHPHIVSIFDTCAGEECEAIVMELVRGRTVREALDEGHPLSVHQAVDIAAQAADALSHAHANGLVHRDVKPGNILLSDDGRVLVTDFGIAKAAEATSDLTEVGQVVGTAKYLSPEQVQGHPLDARSDVYAVGVVLYEMLCGRPPFDAGNSTATALARLTTDPLRPRQVRAGIPRGVEEIVLQAMERRPEDRFRSAASLRGALLAVDLSRVSDEDHTSVVEPNGATVPEEGGPSFARRERSWLVPTVLIVVMAVTLGVVGVLVGGTDVGQELFGSNHPAATTTSHPIAIGAPTSFDPPPGDGSENDRDLPRLVDGNAASVWRTDLYRTAALGGLKQGVGVVLPLTSPSDIGSMTVESPNKGWKASVYVSSGPSRTMAGWGDPVATVTGSGTVQLGGRHAGAVLLWITELAPEAGGFRVSIGELRLAT